MGRHVETHAVRVASSVLCWCYRYLCGRLAQLVRAPASHAGGRRFESYTAHHGIAKEILNAGILSRVLATLG
jgi:hypothetical protein